MRDMYEKPELELITFKSWDVITTSQGGEVDESIKTEEFPFNGSVEPTREME